MSGEQFGQEGCFFGVFLVECNFVLKGGGLCGGVCDGEERGGGGCQESLGGGLCRGLKQKGLRPGNDGVGGGVEFRLDCGQNGAIAWVIGEGVVESGGWGATNACEDDVLFGLVVCIEEWEVEVVVECVVEGGGVFNAISDEVDESLWVRGWFFH